MLSPISPFIQVEGVGRNHAVEFDHKGVKYLKDAINNVWELENPEYVESMQFSINTTTPKNTPSVGNQRDYILRLKDISQGSIRHITAPIDIEMPEDRLIDVTTLGLHPSQESLPIVGIALPCGSTRQYCHGCNNKGSLVHHTSDGTVVHLHDMLLDPQECQRQYRSRFVPLIDGDEFITTDQEVAAGRKYTVRGGRYLGWYDEEQDDIKQPLNETVRLGLPPPRLGMEHGRQKQQQSDAAIAEWWRVAGEKKEREKIAAIFNRYD